MSSIYFMILFLPVALLIYVNISEAKRRSRLIPQERSAEYEEARIEMRIW